MPTENNDEKAGLSATKRNAKADFRYEIGTNRAAAKYSRKELAGRVAWAFCRPFFRLSPRLLWRWRVFMLRMFGARIGAAVRVFPDVDIIIPWNLELGNDVTIGARVILYALGPIKIGDGTTVSQGCHVCAGTHDFRDPSLPLQKPPIEIGESVWVCADSFIGPNITIGNAAVVGARSVVMRDVAAGDVVAGNPAKTVGKR